MDYDADAIIIQCTICGSILQSKHRHDYYHCKCANVFVDGGNDYPRFGWTKEFPIILKEFGVKNGANE